MLMDNIALRYVHGLWGKEFDSLASWFTVHSYGVMLDLGTEARKVELGSKSRQIWSLSTGGILWRTTLQLVADIC
jgi:hypothetical protein